MGEGRAQAKAEFKSALHGVLRVTLVVLTYLALASLEWRVEG